MKLPKLTLVGAGPGDPDLITIKGVKALMSADVVLYDALVDSSLLQYAPDALHVPVGKRAGKSSVSQQTINQLIVEHALTNGHVVRLKGGDPFVFGRGMEEMAHARQFGIETEVVVGVSSIMLPGLYGVPLTQRGVNQSFTVVTATGADGRLTSELKAAARDAPTALIFMGLRKIQRIVAEYQFNNRGTLPVAVISNGSLLNEKVITGTVNTIADELSGSGVEAPALLVFGEGAACYSSENMMNIQKEAVA
ncbi:MAG: uroporphyrinogen-III C-methyltransferase [Cyclobacteriaceae bacterium]